MGVGLDFSILASSLLTISLITKAQSIPYSPVYAPKIVFATVMVTLVGF